MIKFNQINCLSRYVTNKPELMSTKLVKMIDLLSFMNTKKKKKKEKRKGCERCVCMFVCMHLSVEARSMV